MGCAGIGRTATGGSSRRAATGRLARSPIPPWSATTTGSSCSTTATPLAATASAWLRARTPDPRLNPRARLPIRVRMVPSASLFAIAAAADADTRLAVHRDWLARAEELAETLEVRGHDEDAVGVAGQGARFALFAHPGVLVRPRLERLFARVAARTLTQVPRPHPPSSPPRRVLHVASETYTSGGHTRVLWRWIDRDRGRVHDVVLTQQCTELMPGLRKAIKRTKGSLIELPAAAPLLERAQRLRELVAKAGAVVLHTHSFDPIATLALAGMEDRPPTLFNDHASNVFWFGRSVSDLVIGGPAELPEITARRGVPADRYAGVPFPVGG